MTETSESQGETKPPEAASDTSGPSTTAVLDWALKLSAEERGWIDQAYQAPREVIDLAARLSHTCRSFYVLTGLWGIGKSSALQFICEALGKISGRRHEVYLLRLAPHISILDQMVTDNVRDPTLYWHGIRRELERRYKQGRLAEYSFRQAIDEFQKPGGDFTIAETLIPKTTLTRIRQQNVINLLGKMDTILLDLPDFSRTDRRPLIRMLDQVQDVWLKLMQDGAVVDDEPIGPNLVITLQKELSDLAPTYFLGKANIVELKPLTAEQLIEAYNAKFPKETASLIDPPALDYLAHLSRGVFRRFLKFLAAVMQDAESRKLARVTLSAAMAAITPTQVSQEMEAELAYIFPKPDMREKAAKIIMALLQAKYHPSRLQPFLDPNLAKRATDVGLTQKEIAEMLSLTEVDVSRLVNRLVANDVVTRARVHVGKDEHGFDVTRTVLRLNM